MNDITISDRVGTPSRRPGATPPARPGAGPRIAPGVDLDPDATLADGTTVWHLAQVREDARIGRDCTIGRGAYIGPGVRIGERCKVQNHALIYEPAVLEDGVFVGPAVVLTNDLHPRAITPDGHLKGSEDWTAVGVVLRSGASIGARAVCVAPVTVGRWAMVAAGAVVTRDVPDFALMAGAPARRIGWVGAAGHRLIESSPGIFRCPVSGNLHVERDGVLQASTAG